MSWFKFLKKDKEPGRTWAILDVNDKDFQQQVIRRSYKTPVMVDFWAEWCGPCRQLGPILEDLALDSKSGFVLAKLDTENNQRIASKFQIRSIPNVKMFRNGQIAGEFTGARPAVLVKRFVQKTIEEEPPTPRISGSSDPVRRLEQAKQHLRKGRGFEAYVLLANFPESAEQETAQEILPLARFLFDMDDGDALTGIEDLDQLYETAVQSLTRRSYDQALDALFSALELGTEENQRRSTAVIEGLFTFLGEDHEVTKTHRQKIPAESGS